jgi:hypothetical protein
MSINEKPSMRRKPEVGNKSFSRKNFLKLIPPALLAGFLSSHNIATSQAQSTKSGINLHGKGFEGWTVNLGDALYARPGEAPVDITDIETAHLGKYSELKANIKRRVIMAHNVTFKRIIDKNVLHYSHECAYQFRLPYLPRPVVTDEWNAQTLEGGFFVWDGANTRLDYGTAFQWNLNPWGDVGAIGIWTANGDAGQWITVGRLIPDTNWHHVKLVVDVLSETTVLIIDETRYPAVLSKTTKPDSWGTEVAARLQAEIVSIYPEPSGLKAAHKAQFRNWKWHSKLVHSQ